MSITVNGITIEPTIFPDGTSQVWKLQEEVLRAKQFNIEFNFENEGEIFHLQQLMSLLKHGNVPCTTRLHMPFLPYGRQDKEISNETTFALRTFASIINLMRFDVVTTLDAHSNVAEDVFDNFVDISAEVCIGNAFEDSGADIMAYPDAGAEMRYSRYFGKGDITGHKVRDQLTGYITDYSIEGDPKGKNILIVDDICDGGMTFILFTKELLQSGAKSVNLYVTHGIFSKGLKVLKEAGISRIFTKNGEVE